MKFISNLYEKTFHDEAEINQELIINELFSNMRNTAEDSRARQKVLQMFSRVCYTAFDYGYANVKWDKPPTADFKGQNKFKLLKENPEHSISVTQSDIMEKFRTGIQSEILLELQIVTPEEQEMDAFIAKIKNKSKWSGTASIETLFDRIRYRRSLSDSFPFSRRLISKFIHGLEKKQRVAIIKPLLAKLDLSYADGLDHVLYAVSILIPAIAAVDAEPVMKKLLKYANASSLCEETLKETLLSLVTRCNASQAQVWFELLSDIIFNQESWDKCTILTLISYVIKSCTLRPEQAEELLTRLLWLCDHGSGYYDVQILSVTGSLFPYLTSDSKNTIIATVLSTFSTDIEKQGLEKIMVLSQFVDDNEACQLLGPLLNKLWNGGCSSPLLLIEVIRLLGLRINNEAAQGFFDDSLDHFRKQYISFDDVGVEFVDSIKCNIEWLTVLAPKITDTQAQKLLPILLEFFSRKWALSSEFTRTFQILAVVLIPIIDETQGQELISLIFASLVSQKEFSDFLNPSFQRLALALIPSLDDVQDQNQLIGIVLTYFDEFNERNLKSSQAVETILKQRINSARFIIVLMFKLPKSHESICKIVQKLKPLLRDDFKELRTEIFDGMQHLIFSQNQQYAFEAPYSPEEAALIEMQNIHNKMNRKKLGNTSPQAWFSAPKDFINSVSVVSSTCDLSN